MHTRDGLSSDTESPRKYSFTAITQGLKKMFGKQSLVTRIAVGKAIGLVVGICGFFCLPLIAPESSSYLRWGILLWYTTVGAIIGVFGVMTWHPILRVPLPWWLRAPLIGCWMNFVLVFFAYHELQQIMDAAFGAGGAISSPFWIVAEGGAVGLLIGFFATKLGGEGGAIVDR